MPAVHEEHKKILEQVELILQYLSHPENLTAPDSEHIRAILAEKALDELHRVLTSD